MRIKKTGWGARRLAMAAVALTAVGSWGLGGALALPRWTAPVQGRVATDTVDIALEDEGIGDGAVVVDDSTVAHRLAVTNRGAPCWVRVRTQLVDGEGNVATVTDRVVPEGREPEVKMAQDGFAYLTRPLDEDETWVWEEELGCPSGTLASASGEVRVLNTVEAVQRGHVEPRFDEGEPWGGVAAEAGLHTRGERDGGGAR